MEFSAEHTIDFADSVNDHVMVRNVSCLFYDDKIYFKTDKNCNR